MQDSDKKESKESSRGGLVRWSANISFSRRYTQADCGSIPAWDFYMVKIQNKKELPAIDVMDWKTPKKPI